MANEEILDRYGFAYVDVDIKPKNSNTMTRVKYKIDTGANCTTISKKMIYKLGYDDEWIKSGKLMEGATAPTLASGLPVPDCYEVILPEIHIGEWVGYNWPITTSLTVPFRFLLGTDSMQFFNWHFDYERGVCRFDLIKGKRKLLFNKKEQSIHTIDETNTAN